MNQRGYIRIVQYNILSPTYCTREAYPHTDVLLLNPEVRFSLIANKLHKECLKNAIICLQEVDMFWESRLQLFFHQRGYTFICTLYKNGCQGVGIAFPLAIYKLFDCKICRPVESKLWPLNDNDTWFHAKRKENVCIMLRLQSIYNQQQPFVVASYHMPCAFQTPTLMVIHAALLFQTVLTFVAKNDPIIVTGDFNTKREDSVYKLITTGSISEASPDYPLHPNDKWSPCLTMSFRDTNPDITFTNFRHNFQATLDYIFCSHHWKILHTSPSNEELSKEFHLTHEEPSDHVLLSCVLKL